MGPSAAFVGLALVGAAAWALLWAAMPETRPGKPITGTPAPAPA